MAARLRYVHRVYSLEPDQTLGRVIEDIETKKAFKAAMVRHFFEDGGGPVAFHLVDSPNSVLHEVHPYVNQRGNPSVLFSLLAADYRPIVDPDSESEYTLES